MCQLKNNTFIGKIITLRIQRISCNTTHSTRELRCYVFTDELQNDEYDKWIATHLGEVASTWTGAEFSGLDDWRRRWVGADVWALKVPPGRRKWDPPHGLLPWRGRRACVCLRSEEARPTAAQKKVTGRW